MKYSRDSFIVKCGRLYQQVSPIFSFIDYIPRLFIRKKLGYYTPMIILLAPPRSGSTLLYQVLSSGFRSIYLSNLWNLLYATPLIGGLLSESIRDSTRISSFKSNKGFVPGIVGEAEGLKFWSYWMGQSLDERYSKIFVKKSLHLVGSLNILGNHFSKPCITCYLGHVFCIKKLRKLFPNSLFIHLTRNLIDNGMSLYTISPSKMFSSKPRELNNFPYTDRLEQIAAQLIHIHKRIIDNSDDSCINISYSQLCKSPQVVIERIEKFAKERNIFLELCNIDKLPEKFTLQTFDREDSNSKKLNSYIEIELENLDQSYHNFFNSLIQ